MLTDSSFFGWRDSQRFVGRIKDGNVIFIICHFHHFHLNQTRRAHLSGIGA